MDDYKNIIAQNLTSLRKSLKLTQAELAEKLDYSDKAISKWERAEAIPDAVTLKQIADLFCVTIDYLFQQHETDETELRRLHIRQSNRLMVTLLGVLTVWFIATAIFVVLGLQNNSFEGIWIVYVLSVPASMIVLLVFNTKWGKWKYNFWIISIMIWSVLASAYLMFLHQNIWIIFMTGVPAQLATLVWFVFDKSK